MQRNYIDWPLICSPTAEQFELAEKQRAETANLDDEIVFYNLSGALAKHPDVFSNFYVNMVKVGEETGKLPNMR